MTGKSANVRDIMPTQDRILLSQDWFIVNKKKPFGNRLKSHKITFKLVDNKPVFECENREEMKSTYDDFWETYVEAFENGDMIITQSGYFYFPDKAEIHILMTGFKEIVSVDHDGDAKWIKNEIENNRHIQK